MHYKKKFFDFLLLLLVWDSVVEWLLQMFRMTKKKENALRGWTVSQDDTDIFLPCQFSIFISLERW